MEQLEALYGEKNPNSVIKEIDHINGGYRKLIEAAPFVAVATCGPEGLDCSPKGDPAGFVRILDDKTIAIPDRPWQQPASTASATSCAIRAWRSCSSFPASAKRCASTAAPTISIDPELMQSFAINGKLPRCVMVVHIESIYFHCSKAIVRSKLWDEATKIDRKNLPSTGTIVAELSGGKAGGEEYDRAAPERIKAQLY